LENDFDAFDTEEIMKRLFLFLGLFLLSFLGVGQKNILIFLVDDLGWTDNSLRKPAIFRTPNMEKLARKGVEFTQAYANQNCTPTRVSLLTGMNALNHKVTSWTFQKDENPNEGGNPRFAVPEWNMNGISPSAGVAHSIHATTIAQVLAARGYATIQAGKAHFGAYNTPAADPKNLGFQVNIGGTAAGQPASYYGKQAFGNDPQKPNIRAVPHLQRFHGKDIFLTEAITQETMRVMDSILTKPKPFFLLFSNYAVHTPIQGDPRFVGAYYKQGMDSTEAKYASLVEGMDKALGDWMQYLDEKDLTKNTVIVFLSDNGGLTDVGRGVPGRNTYNTPLRSGKTSGYEGGLRIPLIVSGLSQRDSRSQQPILVEDLFPSILDWTKTTKPKLVQSVDGKSIIPFLDGKKSDASRLLFWHHPHMRTNGSRDIQPFSAVRQGDWKLIFFHQDQHFELYNTKTDLSEQTNLYTKESAKAEFLAKALGQKLRETKSHMLIDRQTNLEILYPF
jgi:arylsulfatase A-like enzyme